MKELIKHTGFVIWDGFFMGMAFISGAVALSKFAMWANWVAF